MKILVTRPEVDQQQTLAALQALGIETLSSPVMEIVPLAFDLPDDPWQGIIVTSRNGLRMLAEEQIASLRYFPLYCVGKRTGELAKRLGFEVTLPIAATVAELGALLVERLDPHKGPVLYLAGRDRAGSLEDVLKLSGFTVTLREIYQGKPSQTLSGEAEEALRTGHLDAILLYSERSSRLLLSLIEKAGLSDRLEKVVFYCLSPAVALPLEGLGYPLVVADAPNERSLLECVQNGHN
nr:uroporphyrinogen-III synthase [uncultured Cohaesibacter sp.]